MSPPPRWARRLLLAPAVPLATLGLVTTLPLTALAAAAVSPRLPGRLRPLRLLWFALVVLVVESIGLLGCFALWVASGFGWKAETRWYRDAHYTLMRWYARAVVRSAGRTFNLRVRLRGAVADDRVASSRRTSGRATRSCCSPREATSRRAAARGRSPGWRRKVTTRGPSELASYATS